MNTLFRLVLGGRASCDGPGWHFNLTHPSFDRWVEGTLRWANAPSTPSTPSARGSEIRAAHGLLFTEIFVANLYELVRGREHNDFHLWLTIWSSCVIGDVKLPTKITLFLMSWVLQSRESENSLSETSQEETCSLPPLECVEMTSDSTSRCFWVALECSSPLFLSIQRLVITAP